MWRILLSKQERHIGMSETASDVGPYLSDECRKFDPNKISTTSQFYPAHAEYYAHSVSPPLPPSFFLKKNMYIIYIEYKYMRSFTVFKVLESVFIDCAYTS